MTHHVATKLPNGYRLRDMLENVRKWVQDASKQYGEHILKDLREAGNSDFIDADQPLRLTPTHRCDEPFSREQDWERNTAVDGPERPLTSKIRTWNPIFA